MPPLRAPVTDLTGTLTPQQIATLEQTLRAFEARKGSQIAVLIVPTTQPETIEQYSIRVAEAWKLGRRGVDDGVLLLVAKDDRARAHRSRLRTGRRAARRDRESHHRSGHRAAVSQRRFLSAASTRPSIASSRSIEGEPLPEALQRRAGASRPGSSASVLPILLMLVFVVGGILRRMFGSFGGAAVTAGVAGSARLDADERPRRRDRRRGAWHFCSRCYAAAAAEAAGSARVAARWGGGLGRRLGRWRVSAAEDGAAVAAVWRRRRFGAMVIGMLTGSGDAAGRVEMTAQMSSSRVCDICWRPAGAASRLRRRRR